MSLLGVLALWTKALIWARRDEERGASMVEYALLLVLIAIIAFVAIRMSGRNVSRAFTYVGRQLRTTN